jgi:hypothetical protein
VFYRNLNQKLTHRRQEAACETFASHQLFFSAAKTKPEELQEMVLTTKEEVGVELSIKDVVLYVPPTIAHEFIDQAASVSMLFVSFERLFQSAIVNDVKLEEFNGIIYPAYCQHMSSLMKLLINDQNIGSVSTVIDIDRIEREKMSHALFEYLYALVGFPTPEMACEAGGDPLGSLTQTMESYFLNPDDLFGYFGTSVRQKTHLDVTKALSANKRRVAGTKSHPFRVYALVSHAIHHRVCYWHFGELITNCCKCHQS